MNPFSYTCAADPQQATQATAANASAKFLAGGTNLIDLMKMGVERPTQLVDLNRLPLAQIEELPNGGGVRIGALARNSDVAEHALIVQRYPVLSQALLAGALSCGILRQLAAISCNEPAVTTSTIRRFRSATNGSPVAVAARWMGLIASTRFLAKASNVSRRIRAI